MKIAVHSNPRVFNHSTSWAGPWQQACEEAPVECHFVDLFEEGVLRKLASYDAVLWHFSNYSHQEMLFARSILAAASAMGLAIFPDHNTAWHFDDKVAQMYLLEAVAAPIPEWNVFADVEGFKLWLEGKPIFPQVAKLRGGSGSSNVKLLENPRDATRYADDMFKRGRTVAPNPMFKAISNARSASTRATFFKRLKRAPEFLRTMRSARQLPRERGYVFLQEFIPNDGYDLKVVTVGDKTSFIARNNRAGDFRASGGGSLSYDLALVPRNVVETAFSVTDRIGAQCMGYDFVIDSRTGVGEIIEMSYGFDHRALVAAGGHWDRSGDWHQGEPLSAPAEIVENLIKAARSRNG